MRALIFDPFAGISGDMILGSLLDLGLPAEWLNDFVASLGLPDIHVVIDRVERRGISCAQLEFRLPPQHVHRHLRDVLEILEASPAPASVKTAAGATFQRLAQAEAEIHGTTIERVHFHEVGALDSILDVMCGIAGVEQLGVERCYTRPVALGRGWIQIEHGRFPVPAPVTLKLLAGVPVRDDGLEGECTTPTGAALLATLTEGRAAPPQFTPLRVGFGAGSRDPEDRPNCLRTVLAEVEVPGQEQLFLVQADVDDLPPEYLPAAQDALLAAGALDAVVLPVGMKKGRVAARLEVLAAATRLDVVLATIFRETTTIGVRYWPVTRPVLRRKEDVVEWRGQRVRRKRVRLPDGTERVKPEHDDVLRAARALGVPPYQARLELEDRGDAVVRDEQGAAEE